MIIELQSHIFHKCIVKCCIQPRYLIRQLLFRWCKSLWKKLFCKYCPSKAFIWQCRLFPGYIGLGLRHPSLHRFSNIFIKKMFPVTAYVPRLCCFSLTACCKWWKNICKFLEKILQGHGCTPHRNQGKSIGTTKGLKVRLSSLYFSFLAIF